jgi:hypothetical protein
LIYSRSVKTIKPFDNPKGESLNRRSESPEGSMTDYENRYDDAPAPRRGPGFLPLFIGKVILLALTIIVVWLLYGYLFAFQLDFLGWAYTKLQPLTNYLYMLVDNYFPDSIKYKFRAAITDDLGQRALFLLILTAVVELTLYTLFRFLKFLFIR